jgi:hypothetical protein
MEEERTLIHLPCVSHVWEVLMFSQKKDGRDPGRVAHMDFFPEK